MGIGLGNRAALAVFVAVAATGHLINTELATSGPESVSRAAERMAQLAAEAAEPIPTLMPVPAIAYGHAPGPAPVPEPELAPVTDVVPTLGPLPAAEEETRAPIPRLAQADGCEARMSAARAGAGLARLAIRAPCRAGERLTIQHDALSFTILLGDGGRADIEVPALAPAAAFFAFFDDATGAMAELRMPEVALFERAGVMWQGGDALGLHASEFGAPFGSEGHVWAGNPGSPARAAEGTGGFLVTLGDGQGEAPQFAEVYTFPASLAPQEGTVEIAIEAGYDAQACGRALTATALRAGQGGVTLVPVSLALPDCDTARPGGFVQLNGTLEPITLASD